MNFRGIACVVAIMISAFALADPVTPTNTPYAKAVTADSTGRLIWPTTLIGNGAGFTNLPSGDVFKGSNNTYAVGTTQAMASATVSANASNGTQIVNYRTMTNQLASYYLNSNPSNFVTASVTNGLVGSSVTNGLASMIFVTNYVNGNLSTSIGSINITNQTPRWNDYIIYATNDNAVSISMTYGQMANVWVQHSTSNHVVTWPTGVKLQWSGSSLSDTNTTGATDTYGIACIGTNGPSGTLTTNVYKTAGVAL